MALPEHNPDEKPGFFGGFGFLIAIIAIVIGLLTVIKLFMG